MYDNDDGQMTLFTPPALVGHGVFKQAFWTCDFAIMVFRKIRLDIPNLFQNLRCHAIANVFLSDLVVL